MKTRIYIIASLLIMVLISSVVISNSCNDNFKNIFIGICSSSLVVLIIEIIALIKDYNRLSIINESYGRTKITTTVDKRNIDGIYEDITQRYLDKGVNSVIEMNYQGDGEYKGKADYEEGTVGFTINLNKTNPKIGSGTYQYLKKGADYKMPDLGTYQIQIDEKNNDTIYVYYSNVIPSGLANGYEIWTKQKRKQKNPE